MVKVTGEEFCPCDNGLVLLTNSYLKHLRMGDCIVGIKNLLNTDGDSSQGTHSKDGDKQLPQTSVSVMSALSGAGSGGSKQPSDPYTYVGLRNKSLTED